MQYTAATNFFGPDYEGIIPELVGSFEIKANSEPFDVSMRLGSQNMSLLPPGGYLIRYIDGSYLVMNKVPTFLAIGGPNGLQVSWKSNRGKTWTTIPFNITYEASDARDMQSNISPSQISNITQLEFTRSHRLRLIPPSKAAGSVKIKILRYASKHLMHPNEDDLIKETLA